MELIIDAAGGVRCLYDEAIDLAALGELHIVRASHVEPDENGCWWSDLSPVGGPWCGPFEKRSEALAAEREWLNAHVIGVSKKSPNYPGDENASDSKSCLYASSHAAR